MQQYQMIKDSTINTSSKQKVITQIHALTHNKNKHDKTGIHNTYQQDTTLNPIVNSSRLTQSASNNTAQRNTTQNSIINSSRHTQSDSNNTAQRSTTLNPRSNDLRHTQSGLHDTARRNTTLKQRSNSSRLTQGASSTQVSTHAKRLATQRNATMITNTQSLCINILTINVCGLKSKLLLNEFMVCIIVWGIH